MHAPTQLTEPPSPGEPSPSDEGRADGRDAKTTLPLARRFERLRQVAHGGMGIVFAAREVASGRRVAIKVLNSAAARDGASLARFRREALRLSQARHPNIVEFIEHGVDAGAPYIVMEFLEGETLAALQSRRGGLPVSTFVPIAVQILDAVGHAHRCGLIVRDIKPDNIMLCPAEEGPPVVKLLDFGLTRGVGDTDRITRGELVGTPSCISPEEIRGEGLSLRSDVYALGVLFYRMLAGRPPFTAESVVGVLHHHLHTTPAPLRGRDGAVASAVPQTLEALVLGCLAKDPVDRHADANALQAQFLASTPAARHKVGKSRGPSARRTSEAQQPSWKTKVSQFAAGGLGGLLTAAIVFTPWGQPLRRLGVADAGPRLSRRFVHEGERREAAGDRAGARVAFEEALREMPANAAALAGLSRAGQEPVAPPASDQAVAFDDLPVAGPPAPSDFAWGEASGGEPGRVEVREVGPPAAPSMPPKRSAQAARKRRDKPQPPPPHPPPSLEPLAEPAADRVDFDRVQRKAPFKRVQRLARPGARALKPPRSKKEGS